MRAVRRWTRPATDSPLASTSTLPPCPACRRSISSTLPPLPVAARTTSKQSQSSSWAALSRGAQAIFSPRNTPDDPTSSSLPSTDATTTARDEAQLSSAAQQLVAELKHKRPDPHRIWALFTQLDLAGETSTIPLRSFHYLFRAIHIQPAKTARDDANTPAHLSVPVATAAARTYASKIDLLRLRLRQAGGTETPGDFGAMLWQYHALHYAPGVSKLWDEMIEAGYYPTVPQCERFFETLTGWIDMHARTGGKNVARVAAVPLVQKAASMLEDIKGDVRKTDAVLHSFFRILIKARQVTPFAAAYKAVYGFDIKLPGATVELRADQRAKLRKIGENEACLALEMLSEMGDLSGMVAVFEAFDQPSPVVVPEEPTSFFATSWSLKADPVATPSTSITAASDAEASTLSDSTPVVHPIGTRAFSLLIQTAGRLDNGPLVRHYFDQLNSRWQHQANVRISRIEQAVGIDYTAREWSDEEVYGDDIGADAELSADVLKNLVAAAETSTISASSTTATSTTASDATSATSPIVDSTPTTASSVPSSARIVAPLGTPLNSPERPYAVPSTLIRDVIHNAKNWYDHPTARWIRYRTLRTLQIMGEHTMRISAVLDKLEPNTTASSATPSSTEVEADTTTASPPTPTPQSLSLLIDEINLISFHRLQIRYMLSIVKADSNIVGAYTHYRRRTSAHSSRLRRLAAPSLPKTKIVQLRPGTRRKEVQALSSQILVVRQRLVRLYQLGRAQRGRKEFEMWFAELGRLRKEAHKVGMRQEDEVNVEGQEGLFDVGGAAAATVEEGVMLAEGEVVKPGGAATV